MTKLSLCGMQITVYGKGRRAVWLNTFADEGTAAFAQITAEDCALIALAVPDWDRMLSPWPAPALMPQEADFAGGAAEYLHMLTGEIMPQVCEQCGIAAEKHILAGYSLAGLFALWALCQTDAFCAAGSMSGSLWYPGFPEYTQTHAMKRRPEMIYLSVGDRECRTSHPLLSQVQANTEAYADMCRAQGIETVFELNKGGHTKNAAGRTARGIGALLAHCV